MAHDTLTVRGSFDVGMLPEKTGDLGLANLRKQGARAIAQNLRELVVEGSWLLSVR